MILPARGLVGFRPVHPRSPCANRHEVTMQVVEARDLSVKHGKPHCYVKVDVVQGNATKPVFRKKTKVCCDVYISSFVAASATK